MDKPKRKPYRHWTPGEIALIGTMPREELATLIGRTTSEIRSKATRLGISLKRSPRNKPKPRKKQKYDAEADRRRWLELRALNAKVAEGRAKAKAEGQPPHGA